MTYRDLSEKLWSMFNSVRNENDCALVYSPWEDMTVVYTGQKLEQLWSDGVINNWLTFDSTKPVSRMMIEAWLHDIDIKFGHTVFAIRVFGKHSFSLRTN